MSGCIFGPNIINLSLCVRVSLFLSLALSFLLSLSLGSVSVVVPAQPAFKLPHTVVKEKQILT